MSPWAVPALQPTQRYRRALPELPLTLSAQRPPLQATNARRGTCALASMIWRSQDKDKHQCQNSAHITSQCKCDRGNYVPLNQSSCARDYLQCFNCQCCGGLRQLLSTLTFCSEAAPHHRKPQGVRTLLICSVLSSSRCRPGIAS